MVFVKFHNMKQEKKSNVAFKLKQTHKFPLYNKSKQYYNQFTNVQFSFFFLFFFNLCTVYFTKNCSFFSNITITVQKCSVFFSFFFFFFSIYVLSISLKKISVLSFFLFSICCVQQCSSFFSFFFSVLFPLTCTFLFLFLFSFFSFFFHNKLLIQCPFISTLYRTLSVFTLTQ